MGATRREVQVIKANDENSVADKIRVAAYCRVSSNKEDALNSFFAQMKYYNDFVRMHDSMILVDIYADEGITGTSVEKRPEFKRMIQDCKNRKIDRVLVKSVTRFARNSLECIEIVRQLQSNGVSIFFENDNLDTEVMNSELILYIKSAFAQGEALSASRRMATSTRMRMEDGTYINASVPLGYKMVDRQMVIDEEEAELVRIIFKMYLEGYGVSVIGKKLNADKKQDEKQVSVKTIQYVLSNEKYIGNTLWQKKYTPNQLPLKLQVNRGEMPKYFCENTHESIISKQDFDAVQQLMKQRKDNFCKDKSTKEGKYNRFIICRDCGWVYKQRQEGNSFLYSCSKKGRTLQKCTSKMYSDKQIDKAFIEMYNKLRQNEKLIIDDTINQLKALKYKIASGNNELEEIEMEMARLGESNRTYAELFEKSVIAEVVYNAKVGKFKKQLDELKVRKSKIINEDEDEKCIEELRLLKRVLSNYPKTIVDFDIVIFNKTIDKMYAEKDGALTFVTKGGLSLQVKMN